MSSLSVKHPYKIMHALVISLGGIAKIGANRLSHCTCIILNISIMSAFDWCSMAGGFECAGLLKSSPVWFLLVAGIHS